MPSIEERQLRRYSDRVDHGYGDHGYKVVGRFLCPVDATRDDVFVYKIPNPSMSQLAVDRILAEGEWHKAYTVIYTSGRQTTVHDYGKAKAAIEEKEATNAFITIAGIALGPVETVPCGALGSIAYLGGVGLGRQLEAHVTLLSRPVAADQSEELARGKVDESVERASLSDMSAAQKENAKLVCKAYVVSRAAKGTAERKTRSRSLATKFKSEIYYCSEDGDWKNEIEYSPASLWLGSRRFLHGETNKHCFGSSTSGHTSIYVCLLEQASTAESYIASLETFLRGQKHHSSLPIHLESVIPPLESALDLEPGEAASPPVYMTGVSVDSTARAYDSALEGLGSVDLDHHDAGEDSNSQACEGLSDDGLSSPTDMVSTSAEAIREPGDPRRTPYWIAVEMSEMSAEIDGLMKRIGRLTEKRCKLEAELIERLKREAENIRD